MKKTKIFTLLSLTVALCSCSFFDHFTDKSFLLGETVEGTKISYSFNISEKEKVYEELDKCLALATEAIDYSKFVSSYNKVGNYYSKVQKAYDAESLKFYMYGKKESQTLKLEYYEIYLKMYETIHNIHHIVYKNAFKDQFYEGMSEEEIIDYIGKEHSERFYELVKKSEEIVSEYQALDEKSASFYSEAERLYIEFVKNGNNLANEDGYSNYLSYAYEDTFSRDYHYTDTDAFYDYVKEYAFPYFQSLKSDVTNRIAKLSNKERNYMKELFEGNIFLGDFSVIEDFKDYIGGDYKTIFDDLWYYDKNYYLSYEDNATTAAFTSDMGPYVFFGNRFEGFTVIHEFGHYYNYVINEYDHPSYDLLETHSQGNEMLFSEYLNISGKYSESLTKLIKDYGTLETLNSIIACSSVNEIEKRIYEDDNFTYGDLDSFIDDLYDEIPIDQIFNLKNYMRRVGIDTAGYYISYATSGIGALQILRIAESNFKKGYESWNSLIKRNKDDNDDYIKVYSRAGLTSPFEETTFIKIFENNAN